MNAKNEPSEVEKAIDPKVAADWAEVEARRAELNSRVGGDTRRQAIIRRLGFFKRAS